MIEKLGSNAPQGNFISNNVLNLDGYKKLMGKMSDNIPMLDQSKEKIIGAADSINEIVKNNQGKVKEFMNKVPIINKDIINPENLQKLVTDKLSAESISKASDALSNDLSNKKDNDGSRPLSQQTSEKSSDLAKSFLGDTPNTRKLNKIPLSTISNNSHHQ